MEPSSSHTFIFRAIRLRNSGKSMVPLPSASTSLIMSCNSASVGFCPKERITVPSSLVVMVPAWQEPAATGFMQRYGDHGPRLAMLTWGVLPVETMVVKTSPACPTSHACTSLACTASDASFATVTAFAVAHRLHPCQRGQMPP